MADYRSDLSASIFGTRSFLESSRNTKYSQSSWFKREGAVELELSMASFLFYFSKNAILWVLGACRVLIRIKIIIYSN